MCRAQVTKNAEPKPSSSSNHPDEISKKDIVVHTHKTSLECLNHTLKGVLMGFLGITIPLSSTFNLDLL
jgi:hypothetical protein